MIKISKFTVAFIFIIILAFLVRVYGLGSVPAGLTNDEADIGYDAYSLLLTGHDQWGEFIPLTSFKGFGDYRVPLYTYLVVPVVKAFDLNAFSVRLPSAIFGTISVGLIYFVGRKLTDKSEISSQVIAFSAMFIMAISPWAIGLSRIGIESNVAISIFLCALLLFLHAESRKFLYLLSFILFGLTIYTYTSYALFTVLSIVLLFIYFKKIILKQKKIVFVSLVISLLIVVPFFMFRSAVGIRASQVSFIYSQDNIGLTANLNDRRGSCSEIFPGLVCKVFENKQIVIANTFMRNYVNHFSPDFLYVNGTTTQYSILPQRSLLYTIEFLLFLLGIFALLRNKVQNNLVILSILLISPLADSITGDGHFSRASNMMPFLFLTEGVGFGYLYSLFKKGKRGNLFLIMLLAIIFIYSALGFFVSYSSYFPKYYSNYGQYGYEKWAQVLHGKKDIYDRIYVSKFSNDTKQYIYYLFYNKYDPIEFQYKRNVQFSDDNSWVSIDRIENIYFVQRLPSEEELNELSDKKILLVTHPNEFPEDLPLTETIFDKNNNPVFTFVDATLYLKFLKEQKLKNLQL